MFSYIGRKWDSSVRTKKMATGFSDFVPQSQQHCVMLPCACHLVYLYLSLRVNKAISKIEY